MSENSHIRIATKAGQFAKTGFLAVTGLDVQLRLCLIFCRHTREALHLGEGLL